MQAILLVILLIMLGIAPGGKPALEGVLVNHSPLPVMQKLEQMTGRSLSGVTHAITSVQLLFKKIGPTIRQSGLMNMALMPNSAIVPVNDPTTPAATFAKLRALVSAGL